MPSGVGKSEMVERMYRISLRGYRGYKPLLHQFRGYTRYSTPPNSHLTKMAGDQLQLDEVDVERIDYDQEITDQTRSRKPPRSQVLFKMMEKKYFKPPREPHLLTWEAMEQIRYLHAEFPDEWTVERLSHSFPISVRGIQALLHSRNTRRSIDVIVRHDKKVKAEWKALKLVGKGSVTEGPIVSMYEQLKQNNQLHLLANAAGNKALPSPDWRRKLHDVGTVERPAPGQYGRIISDYMALKQTKDVLDERLREEKQQCKTLDDLTLSNQIYLKVITDTWQTAATKTDSDHSSQTSSKESSRPNAKTTKHQLESGKSKIKPDKKAGSVNFEDKEAYQQLNVLGSDTHLSVDPRYGDNVERPESSGIPTGAVMDSSELRRPAMNDTRESIKQYTLRGRRGKRDVFTMDSADPALPVEGFDDINISANNNQQFLNSHDNPALKGTRKIPSTDGKQQNLYSSMSTTHDDENVAMNTPWMIRQDKDIGLKFEVPAGSDDVQPYIYKPDKGYQYPYGHNDQLPQNHIQVPRNKSSGGKNVLYRRGQDVYDDDGEFLYRIPGE